MVGSPLWAHAARALLHGTDSAGRQSDQPWKNHYYIYMPHIWVAFLQSSNALIHDSHFTQNISFKAHPNYYTGIFSFVPQEIKSFIIATSSQSSGHVSPLPCTMYLPCKFTPVHTHLFLLLFSYGTSQSPSPTWRRGHAKFLFLIFSHPLLKQCLNYVFDQSKNMNHG